MKIAIIDDERHCTDRLLHFLQPHRANMEIFCFDTVETAIAGIETQRPNLVFLDVQLQQKTGFDVLSAVPLGGFGLVFTTAYEQYAIDAFKFSAIDYLLKPIAREDFENALQKAFKQLEHVQLNERINLLLSHVSTETPRKISIPSRDGYTFLSIQDIVRCEADVNYTHIFTSDGQKHTVSKPLKHFEGLLTPYRFFRIHNSHLIHLDCVKAYAKNGVVTLLDGTTLEVSSRKKEAFIAVCNGFTAGLHP